MKKNILLICGGGGTEHDISLVSANYLEKILLEIDLYNIYKVIIDKNRVFKINSNIEAQINFNHELLFEKECIKLDFAIPCFHGPPGETGEFQSFLELIKLPYLGCGPEASILSFNKISTKLWFNHLNIPNTPFIFLTQANEINSAIEFFKLHKRVFVKASSQGSSVGCYQVFKLEELENKINQAFKFSNFVLIEKMVEARELEIAVYEYENEIQATLPGEIICPSKFYSFEEKYNDKSLTTTELVARDISEVKIKEMQSIAIKAFKQLKLRHLARIDFFLTTEDEILLNEINTFPGMTPISMFPKMLINNKHSMHNFLKQHIDF